MTPSTVLSTSPGFVQLVHTTAQTTDFDSSLDNATSPISRHSSQFPSRFRGAWPTCSLAANDGADIALRGEGGVCDVEIPIFHLTSQHTQDAQTTRATDLFGVPHLGLVFQCISLTLLKSAPTIKKRSSLSPTISACGQIEIWASIHRNSQRTAWSFADRMM